MGQFKALLGGRTWTTLPEPLPDLDDFLPTLGRVFVDEVKHLLSQRGPPWCAAMRMPSTLLLDADDIQAAWPT